MDKLAKINAAAIIVMVSSGCAITDNNQAQTNRLWRIEQNASGNFAYCQAGVDCSERTPKTLATRKNSVQQAALPEFDQKRVVAQVYFAFGKATITGNNKTVLKNSLTKLKQGKRLLVRGWTDPVGGIDSPVNRKLARIRAEQVKKWLVANGISASVITVEAYPPCCNNPSATAKSPDAVRSKMRTVTIEIY